MPGMQNLPIPEVKKLLDKLPVKYAALAAIGVACGCRISEITSLRRFDLLDADGKLRDELQLYKFKTGKEKKPRGRPKKNSIFFRQWRQGIPGRKLPLPPVLRIYVLRQLKREAALGYDRPDDLVFRGIHNRPLSRFSAYRIFRQVLGVGFGTHWMRKTFAREMFVKFSKRREAIDALEQTRRALGHARLETTIRYLGIRDAEVRDAQNEIFSEWKNG